MTKYQHCFVVVVVVAVAVAVAVACLCVGSGDGNIKTPMGSGSKDLPQGSSERPKSSQGPAGCPKARPETQTTIH